ncbi:MAG: PIG-L family deacetylase [Candidatus Palauibacterales bacterium]|nr:PIG-L family deacetylase [Candidatus Palauibacterales bacterium]MDP2482114.1 PIG-L family deacetylase [Candidatus Palauibacterales bacterium]
MTEPGQSQTPQTLLVALAHPDDEVGMVAAMRAQVERGDRVVLLWLTRGEMTEALGPIPAEEIIRRRTEHGRIAGEILGVETRFLDFPDTGVQATPEAAARVARVIAEVEPDAVLTWGYAWRRGLRHPDHQATGQIVRDAITLARIKRCVHPLSPNRKPVPVFTYRDRHSQLPALAIDATPYREKIRELARHYQRELEFPDPDWLEDRLRAIGRHWDLEMAEEYDAWETRGGIVKSLLPVEIQGPPDHPERTREETL